MQRTISHISYNYQIILLTAPLIYVKVDFSVFNFDVFVAEHARLRVRSAKGEVGRGSAACAYNAMAWHRPEKGIDVQSVSHRARRAAVSRHCGDLSVGCDLAARHRFDGFVNVGLERARLTVFHTAASRFNTGSIIIRAFAFLSSRMISPTAGALIMPLYGFLMLSMLSRKVAYTSDRSNDRSVFCMTQSMSRKFLQ